MFINSNKLYTKVLISIVLYGDAFFMLKMQSKLVIENPTEKIESPIIRALDFVSIFMTIYLAIY